MPATANWTDCAGSCALTDIREVEAGLSPTVGPGWSSFLPVSKLVMGVGWCGARFFGRDLHSRMPLVPTPARFFKRAKKRAGV
jgi:hypothetical protein